LSCLQEENASISPKIPRIILCRRCGRYGVRIAEWFKDSLSKQPKILVTILMNDH
jgi:hypothetical protein